MSSSDFPSWIQPAYTGADLVWRQPVSTPATYGTITEGFCVSGVMLSDLSWRVVWADAPDDGVTGWSLYTGIVPDTDTLLGQDDSVIPASVTLLCTADFSNRRRDRVYGTLSEGPDGNLWLVLVKSCYTMVVNTPAMDVDPTATTGTYIYKSTDEGATFTYVDELHAGHSSASNGTQFGDAFGSSEIIEHPDTGTWILGVRIIPTSTVMGLATQLMYSNDEGATWSLGLLYPTSVGASPGTQNFFYANNRVWGHNNKYVAFADEELYGTVDGETWVNTGTPYQVSEKIVVSWNAADGDVYVMDAGGDSWSFTPPFADVTIPEDDYPGTSYGDAWTGSVSAGSQSPDGFNFSNFNMVRNGMGTLNDPRKAPGVVLFARGAVTGWGDPYVPPIPWNGVGILWSEIDKRDWTFQPQFTRWRHRWRGKRESLKINTEINQFYYDVRRLNSRSEDVSAALVENRSTIRDGGDVTGVEFQWTTDATPTIEPVQLDGMDNIISRIQQLRNRIEDLEQ